MPIQAHGLNDIVGTLTAGKEAAPADIVIAAPVIMKKVAPNCGAPNGFPQGRTPSWINFDHSKTCIPTNEAPNSAVMIKRSVVTLRFWR